MKHTLETFFLAKMFWTALFTSTPMTRAHSGGEAYLSLLNEQSYLWNSRNTPSRSGVSHQLLCVTPSIPDQALAKSPVLKPKNLCLHLALSGCRQGKTHPQLWWDNLQLPADIVQTSLPIFLAFCTINTISMRIPLLGMRKISRSRHHGPFPVLCT